MTQARTVRFRLATALLCALVAVFSSSEGLAAPKPVLWPRWETNDPRSPAQADHAPWEAFLRKYLVTDHPSGINRVRYQAVTPEDRRSLEGYVGELAALRVGELSRAEQKAYWINLYNALTVKVILEHYPVRSIRDIKISPGWFSSGPWDAKLVEIEGEKVSLNDIEHRILRPIWADNRIHFAVNCASLGCPNLQAAPFTAANTERLLDEAARAYVNHPRGARVEGGRLTASGIFDWYQVDFGGSEAGVMQLLKHYADPPLAAALPGVTGSFRYAYDWTLNE